MTVQEYLMAHQEVKTPLSTASTTTNSLAPKTPHQNWDGPILPPQPGMQRKLTRAMQDADRAQYLQQATQDDPKQAARVRACGGPGACAWLLPPTHAKHKMTSEDFALSLRRRLGVPWASNPWGRPVRQHCAHKPVRTTLTCGASLDTLGHHATTCHKGGGIMRRHDAVVRLLHEYARDHLGLPCLLEQHTAPSTPDHEHDRIDLIVQIAGAETHVDVAVVSPLTSQHDLIKTRARHDGHAAIQTANRKRNRYPNLGVLPFVIEDYGRPGKEAIGLVRTLAAADADTTHSQAATHIWQCIQAIVHGHTAQVIRQAEQHHVA